MQHPSGTFWLGPARKDSNGSQFQKTPTSLKIYTIVAGTFYANITILRPKKSICCGLIPGHRPGQRKIDQLWMKGSTNVYFEISVSAAKKCVIFQSNVPDRWGSKQVVPGSLTTGYCTSSRLLVAPFDHVLPISDMFDPFKPFLIPICSIGLHLTRWSCLALIDNCSSPF